MKAEVFSESRCWTVLNYHMNSRDEAKMGDILATEADLLGMIREVNNIQYLHLTI